MLTVYTAHLHGKPGQRPRPPPEGVQPGGCPPLVAPPSCSPSRSFSGRRAALPAAALPGTAARRKRLTHSGQEWPAWGQEVAWSPFTLGSWGARSEGCLPTCGRVTDTTAG